MNSALYLALSTFFYIFLSFYVIKGRLQFKISIGHGDNIHLLRRIRAQSNFIQYTVLFLLLLMTSENMGLAALAVHFFGIVYLLGRAAHAYGLVKAEHLKNGKIQGLKFRSWGMYSTFFSLFCLALYLLFKYFSLLFFQS